MQVIELFVYIYILYEEKKYAYRLRLEFASGCHLTGSFIMQNDILCWNLHGGIVRQWFGTEDKNLFVRCIKLDIAPWSFRGLSQSF